MSENCTHDCGSCHESCASCEKTSFLEPQNAQSNVKKIIGVVSGKGGVGKSIVTSMLAVLAERAGMKTAIMDADVTGPSIPRAFGLLEKAMGDGETLYPVETRTGIKTMSLNLLLDSETAPVVWRGPVIAGLVKQFWKDVVWGDTDIMFIDMPPGTGDVPLTVFQSIPLDGIVIVTSPQELVGMIVEKAVNMANMMQVPVLGLVENLSYVRCPDCGHVIHPFGESRLDATAAKHGITATAQMPIDPTLAKLCDAGNIESFEGDWLNGLLDSLLAYKNVD